MKRQLDFKKEYRALIRMIWDRSFMNSLTIGQLHAMRGDVLQEIHDIPDGSFAGDYLETAELLKRLNRQLESGEKEKEKEE